MVTRGGAEGSRGERMGSRKPWRAALAPRLVLHLGHRCCLPGTPKLQSLCQLSQTFSTLLAACREKGEVTGCSFKKRLFSLRAGTDVENGATFASRPPPLPRICRGALEDLKSPLNSPALQCPDGGDLGDNQASYGR